MKLSRIALGWYASADGTWAVIDPDLGDVPTKTQVEESTARAGILTGQNYEREWQVVHSPGGGLRESMNEGEVVAWTDTLREGREIVARRAGR